MLCDHSMRKSQAYAVSRCLSGEEGNKDSFEVLSGNSGTTVFDFNHRNTFVFIERFKVLILTTRSTA